MSVEYRVIDWHKMGPNTQQSRYTVVRVLDGQLTDEIKLATVSVHNDHVIADYAKMELEVWAGLIEKQVEPPPQC